jgi:arylsulfatase A-like enzyme
MEVPDYGIYADRNWPEPQKGHAAMISRLDRGVGRMMQKLRTSASTRTRLSFSPATTVRTARRRGPDFFDSNGPLRGVKRDLYEGGIRVPLLARWPGRIAGGRGERPCLGLLGLPAHGLAELAVAPPSSEVDGLSLLPTLLGQSGQQRQHEALYWEFHEGGSVQAARMGRWKAVRPFGKDLELYDLRTDLGETRNVARYQPTVVAQMKAYLATARTESEFWPLKG